MDRNYFHTLYKWKQNSKRYWIIKVELWLAGKETKGKLLGLGFGCRLSCGTKHDVASGIGRVER